jgi:integrase
MVKAELLGQHSFPTARGVTVHIYQRGGLYLARGSWQRQRFGATLGANEREANVALRRLLGEIDDGRFQRPSSKRASQMKASAPECLGFAELADRYLIHIGSVRGKKTQGNYRSRLTHAVRFAESPHSRKRWPYAANATVEFVVDLKGHLHRVQTTRNGHPGGKPTPLSTNYIRHILETVQFMFHWAAKPQVRLVPFEFINPVTRELLGDKPSKDPFRPQVLPLVHRISLVKGFDCYQLGLLGLMSVLPLRLEEAVGILVEDCDFDARRIVFRSRYGGADFGKGHQEYHVSLPADLIPILRACAGDRLAGPLFRQRPIWELRKFPKTVVYQPSDVEEELGQRLRRSGASTAQDRKLVFRKLIRDMGGITTASLGREFRAVAKRMLSHRAQPYDLRRDISTEMSSSGISYIALKYLTAHAIYDIMGDYVAVEPVKEMEKYYSHARPLLDAIRERGEELGCVAS